MKIQSVLSLLEVCGKLLRPFLLYYEGVWNSLFRTYLGLLIISWHKHLYFYKNKL